MDIIKIENLKNKYDFSRDWYTLSFDEKLKFVEDTKSPTDIHGHILWNLAGNKPAPTGLPMGLDKTVAKAWKKFEGGK